MLCKYCIMNKIKAIIFPDIHGRTFWKEPLKTFTKEKYPDIDIIFLGDYLDPYVSYDGISKEDAFINFEEILDETKDDSRVTMLIGNHDWHYFVSLDNCRIDKAREKDIEYMFKDNISRFKLVKTLNINDTKYLFTHAGITGEWLEYISKIGEKNIQLWNSEKNDIYDFYNSLSKLNKTHDFELLNKCLENYDDHHYSDFPSMISRNRGGYYAYGSLIWADVHEHLWTEKELSDVYQIFGHTISYPDGYVSEYAISPEGLNFAMIDASQAFVLTEDNEILRYNEYININ